MIRLLRLAPLLALALAPIAHAQKAEDAPARAADLATFVEGTYVGDVIADARGSSRSGVTVTVRRIGPNLVEVSTDYSRIPAARIQLTQALSSIIADGGDHVFVLDRERDPDALSLTIDDASLNVTRHRH